jgi:hypothetical protein
VLDCLFLGGRFFLDRLFLERFLVEDCRLDEHARPGGPRSGNGRGRFEWAVPRQGRRQRGRQQRGDWRLRFADDQRDADVDRTGNFPRIGHHRVEAPSELGGHVHGVEAVVGLGLVENDGDVSRRQPEALEDAEIPAQVHEARPVRRGHGEEVVGGLQGGHEQVAQPLVGVDDDPCPAGPQDVEDSGDVARGHRVGLGRQAGGGQDLEPVRMGQQVLVEDLFEVVALGFRRQGVGDRELRPEPQGGGDLAELEVEVEQHHRLVGRAGQELGGVGGQERLAATTRGGGDHDDAAPPGIGAAVGHRPEAAAGDAGRPRQGPAELVVVGVEGNEVVRADLDDLGQLGPGPLVQGEDDRHPGEAGVERGEAAQPRTVHERRPGHDDVPVPGGQLRLGPGRVGAALDGRAGPGDDVVADAGRQFAAAIDDENTGGGTTRVAAQLS